MHFALRCGGMLAKFSIGRDGNSLKSWQIHAMWRVQLRPTGPTVLQHYGIRIEVTNEVWLSFK